METYRAALVGYGLSRDRIGEDFFLASIDALRESCADRELHIRLRQEASQRHADRIRASLGDKKTRLTVLPVSYAQERTTLQRSIDDLERELRAEEISRIRDIAAWSGQLTGKREEYRAMLQLFSSFAVEEEESRE